MNNSTINKTAFKTSTPRNVVHFKAKYRPITAKRTFGRAQYDRPIANNIVIFRNCKS